MRRGFTLVELLVVIVVIGILSGLLFGAVQRAQTASRISHTKATIAKLNASLMNRWDSYRTRRLPIDPNMVLGQIQTTGGAAYPQLQKRIADMSARRIAASGGALNAYPAAPYDPLSVPATAPPTIYPNSELAAAVRLLAMRELMRYEMPQHLEDFIDFKTPPATPPWPLLKPEVLPVPPPLAVSYLARINKLAVGDPTATPPIPPVPLAQLQSNDQAELLYMILTIGSTDSGVFGEQLPSGDIGDVDGDGLPEFQDAWPVALNSYAPKGRANSPINFLRWAPGFVSSVQPDFFPFKFHDPIGNPPTLATLQDVQAASFEFCLAHHDYFDPLKLDVADVSAAASTATIAHDQWDPRKQSPAGPPVAPRGYQLMPLIYSAGPDGLWAIDYGLPAEIDPYDATDAVTGVLAGTPASGASDDITSHDLDTRSGK